MYTLYTLPFERDYSLEDVLEESSKSQNFLYLKNEDNFCKKLASPHSAIFNGVEKLLFIFRSKA